MKRRRDSESRSLLILLLINRWSPWSSGSDICVSLSKMLKHNWTKMKRNQTILSAFYSERQTSIYGQKRVSICFSLSFNRRNLPGRMAPPLTVLPAVVMDDPMEDSNPLRGSGRSGIGRECSTLRGVEHWLNVRLTPKWRSRQSLKCCSPIVNTHKDLNIRNVVDNAPNSSNLYILLQQAEILSCP